MRRTILLRNSLAATCMTFVVLVANPHGWISNSAFAQEKADQNAALTAPITVSGQTLDVDEKPVAGAKVTLVSTNAIDKWLAETTSDSGGHYVFRDVPLPVKKQGPGAIAAGTFQVFAEADGLGIAWHGMRFYHHGPRPEQQIPQDQDHSFYQNEEIEMNLVLRPAKSLKGRVTDDQDQSVAGVQIALSTLDYLDTEGREHHRNFREFWAMHAAPAKYREATTGADGRFEISGLPDESVVNVRVQHPDYAHQMFLAAITDTEMTENTYVANSAVTIRNGRQISIPQMGTRKVQTSPLTIHARTTRRILVRVIQDDDDRPAAKIRIAATTKGDRLGTGAYGMTNDKGEVELKLPPGTYQLVGDPPRDSKYVRTYDELTVEEKPAEQSCELKLNAGCILILEAVDVETAAGIPGVTFTYDFEEGPRKGRTRVQSSTTYVGDSKTNDKGQFRAVVLPGLRKYFIDRPAGYQIEGATEAEVNCIAGETITVRFELRRQ